MGQDAKPAKATGFRYLLGYVVIQILGVSQARSKTVSSGGISLNTFWGREQAGQQEEQLRPHRSSVTTRRRAP